MMIRSRVHLLGRPLHPLLVTLPISLLAVVPIFDVLYFLRGDPFYFRAAYYDLLLGLMGAAIAGLAGLVDYGAIPRGNSARRAANSHLLSALGVAAFFFLSWLLRRPGLGQENPSAALAFLPSLLGASVLGLTGWYGGELVYRHRVGIYREEIGEGYKSRWNVRGHPVHVMLVPFPAGLFVAGVVLHLIFLRTGDAFWSRLAFYNLGIGWVLGALAALAGIADLRYIPRKTPARLTAIRHLSLAVLFLSLYLIGLVSRTRLPAIPTNYFSAVLLILLLVAWFGLRLVYVHRVGEPRARR